MLATLRPREGYFTGGSRDFRPIFKIGALGPETTSTFNAAVYLTVLLARLCVKAVVVPFPSFDGILDALDRCQIHLAVVPAAMNRASGFFFDFNVELKLNFPNPLPEYGLVVNQDAFDSGNRTLVCREETRPAIPWLVSGLARADELTIRHVASTAEAAQLVADGAAAFSITNEPSAKSHGLEFVRTVPLVTMCWLVFGRRDVDLPFLTDESLRASASCVA